MKKVSHNLATLGSKSRRISLVGFTMVELLVVVAIVGILTAVAVPQFSRYIAYQTRQDQISALSRAINFARIESVRTGRAVSVCPSDAPEGATPVCGSDWAKGWLVYIGTTTPQAILRVQPGWENKGTISSTSNNPITFNPTGQGIGINQTFTFTQPSLADKSFALSFVGRWKSAN